MIIDMQEKKKQEEAARRRERVKTAFQRFYGELLSNPDKYRTLFLYLTNMIIELTTESDLEEEESNEK